jgi:hypothetical protein
MAYLPNIPQSTDQLSISQGNILNNFSFLGAIAGNSINAPSNSINGSGVGFNWLYLNTQGSIPPAGSGFVAGNVALYSALNSGSGQNELYINRTNPGSSVVQIPLTAYNNGTIASSNAPAWTYLPSGMLQISGMATTSSGTLTITFNTAPQGVASFPGFASFVSSIQVTPINNGATFSQGARVKSFSLTGFVAGLTNGSSDSSFFWTATGI